MRLDPTTLLPASRNTRLSRRPRRAEEGICMSSEHRLATRRAAFEALAAMPVEPGTKGISPQVGTLALGEIGRRGWNLLCRRPDHAGGGSPPIGAAPEQRRHARISLQAHAMAIAPHGKTTMAPQLYRTAARRRCVGDHGLHGAASRRLPPLRLRPRDHRQRAGRPGGDRLRSSPRWPSRPTSSSTA